MHKPYEWLTLTLQSLLIKLLILLTEQLSRLSSVSQINLNHC